MSRWAAAASSRGRLVGLVAVLALLAAAFVVGTRGHGRDPAAAAPATLSPALEQARLAAALPACPPGLSTSLPQLRLSCLSGGPAVEVSAAPGRPVLVNLWATWCGPCVDEVPELVRFAAAAGDQVGVVGVVVEDSPASVYAFAKAFGVNYPLVADDLGQVLRHVGTGVPQTLLVRPDGTVAYVQHAAFPSLSALEDAVSVHLGVRV